MADINNYNIPDFGSLLANAGVNQQQTAASARLMGAQAPLVQQQTIAANLANQRAALGLGFLKQQLSGGMNIPDPMSMEGATRSAEQSGEPSGDPLQAEKNALVADATARYQPHVWNPAMQQVYNQLQMKDNMAQALGVPTNFAAMFKGRFDSANMQKQETAANDYEELLMGSKFGYQGIQRYQGGQLADRLRKEGFTDDDVKDLATHMAPVAFKYSGQKATKTTADTYVDETGREIPGVDRLTMSLTAAHDLANKPMTWYDNKGQEVSGTLFQKYNMSEPAMVDYLTTHGGQLPPPRPGSGAAIEATRALPPSKSATTSQNQSALVDPMTKQPVDTSNLDPKTVGFIKSLPYAPGAIPPNPGAKTSEQQNTAFSKWQDQKAALEKANTAATTQATESQANVKRMMNLINSPDGANLGPGSAAMNQFQGFLHQYFGTPANKASASQILTKIIGTDQMNRILSVFHTEGAQVRLGAYESRLIMTMLSAHPEMTKEAITQMLTWQNSDSAYEIKKLTAEGVAIDAGREPNSFGGKYERANPRMNSVDSALTAFGKIDDIRKVPMELSSDEKEAQAEIAAMSSGQRYIWNGRTGTKP